MVVGAPAACSATSGATPFFDHDAASVPAASHVSGSATSVPATGPTRPAYSVVVSWRSRPSPVTPRSSSASSHATSTRSAGVDAAARRRSRRTRRATGTAPIADPISNTASTTRAPVPMPPEPDPPAASVGSCWPSAVGAEAVVGGESEGDGDDGAVVSGEEPSGATPVSPPLPAGVPV